jgi:uncharacterized protein
MGVIRTQDELRRHYRAPVERVLRKELTRLDRHCRRFIALSPFLVMASGDGDGGMDATPRGGEPGFVQVVDDVTLLVPDRPGNNRLDTLANLVARPAVGLIFLIPGVDETLRINGTVEIRDDEELRQRFAVGGRVPATVLTVTVRQAFLHCAKALMRSRLWSDGARIDRSELPTMGEMIRDHIGDPDAAAETQEAMLARYRDAMY